MEADWRGMFVGHTEDLVTRCDGEVMECDRSCKVKLLLISFSFVL